MPIEGVGGYNDKTVQADMYAASVSKSSSLSVDDFLYLLAAQLSNQDMMNPMNDTEFISQLAQFTSLEAMQQLNQLNMTSYSASLLGKEVTVAQVVGNNMIVTTGIVTGVGLYNDEPVIYLDGGKTGYALSEVMVVGKMPEATTEEPKDPDEGDGEGGGEDPPVGGIDPPGEGEE